MFSARKSATSSARQSALTRDAQYTAVVHAGDGVRFVATAQRSDELAAQIVEYIRERCQHTLWDCDARRVHDLIASRNLYAAIALYFSKIGDRWDVEHLELEGASFGPEQNMLSLWAM